jgi:hypothetical protein
MCLPGERQHVPLVVGQALADAHRRLGPAATTGSDDHRPLKISRNGS